MSKFKRVTLFVGVILLSMVLISCFDQESDREVVVDNPVGAPLTEAAAAGIQFEGRQFRLPTHGEGRSIRLNRPNSRRRVEETSIIDECQTGRNTDVDSDENISVRYADWRNVRGGYRDKLFEYVNCNRGRRQDRRVSNEFIQVWNANFNQCLARGLIAAEIRGRVTHVNLVHAGFGYGADRRTHNSRSMHFTGRTIDITGMHVVVDREGERTIYRLEINWRALRGDASQREDFFIDGKPVDRSADHAAFWDAFRECWQEAVVAYGREVNGGEDYSGRRNPCSHGYKDFTSFEEGDLVRRIHDRYDRPFFVGVISGVWRGRTGRRHRSHNHLVLPYCENSFGYQRH